MTDGRQVNEMDLLAYADGLLDADPAHKAAVEQALRDDPAARARADAFRAQTEALRAAYGGRLAEPVPDRLRAVLETGGRRSPSAAVHLAAALLLLLSAGTAGWMLGQGEEGSAGDDRGLQRLAEEIHARFVGDQPSARAPEITTALPSAGPVDWLSDEISLRLKAPDLSAHGYALVEKQAVNIGDEHLVRLDYAGGEGRSFSVFLAPRWKPGSGGITEAERDDVSMAYWVDGPLASTMVARMPAHEVRQLAKAVRAAIRTNGDRPGVVEPVPAGPAATQAEVMADTLAAPRVAIPQSGRGPGEGAVQPN